MLGKTRRPELRPVIDDYVKRIGRHSTIEVTEVRDGDAGLKKLNAESPHTAVRDGDAAIKKLNADRAATAVLLDALGKSLDSNAFAKWLGELRDRGTRE